MGCGMSADIMNMLRPERTRRRKRKTFFSSSDRLMSFLGHWGEKLTIHVNLVPDVRKSSNSTPRSCRDA